MNTPKALNPYGYQELQLTYQHNMALAMMIAIFIQITAIGSLHLAEWLKYAEPPERIIKISPDELLPPPLRLVESPNIGIPVIPTKLAVGLPVPVPECDVNPDITFAGQKDLSERADQQWGQIGEKQVLVDENPMLKDDKEPSPEAWICIEREPVVVITSVPEYPELARRIGLEGSVIVKVLLDKEGRVKKTMLVKTTDEIFSQPALDAAKKWVFTPAQMNRRPVLVWISIPFQFRLTK